MNSRFGIQETCYALDERLIEYIESEYLGKNEELRVACREQLRQPGTLFQIPYAEVSPSYKTNSTGFIYSEFLPQCCKSPLLEMIDKNLGVFKTPYCHQVEALNAYFQGKDVLVSTGTGSGKTECFMWPIVTKLIEEANGMESWQQRGIRVLMMYPLNALVSDQLGRLRKMIGNDDFYDIFRRNTGQWRIPQFGMYTGRTLYPGKFDKSRNREFAETLTKDILNRTDDFKNELKKVGRYPSKHDLEGYVEDLKNGIRRQYSDDAELLLRYEMQDSCPDILITNYTMLEYMLLRHEEDSIWEDTKAWLDCNPSNKLLFVIDEAHMYRGSSGGEVALLIKRLLNRLEISRDRVQFILTSASVPEGADTEIRVFANALTVQDTGIDRFELIKGVREELPTQNLFDIDPASLMDFNLGDLRDDSTVCAALKQFSEDIGLDTRTCQFSNLDDIGHWLYDPLSRCRQIQCLKTNLGGNATRYSAIPEKLFPGVENNVASKALDVILSVAPLAKNESGQVLLPTKLHLFFKGLEGIYACINPQCTEKTDNVPFVGKIYLERKADRCKCGGRIFELTNDRSCGGLFLKAFWHAGRKDDFLWNNPGLSSPSDLTETHFSFKRFNKSKMIIVESKSGYVTEDESKEGKDGYITLYWYDMELKNQDARVPSQCPYCQRTHLKVTDFSTKGDDPFFNIVSKQLSIQPPTLFATEDVKKTPNKGRKVLLFSDSRQSAAKLAKKMSELSLHECMRAAIGMACRNLDAWAKSNEKSYSLDYLYPGLLKVFHDHGTNLSIKDLQDVIKKDLERLNDDLDGTSVDYGEIIQDVNMPDRIKIDLLNQMCSNNTSLTDLALGWVDLTDRSLRRFDWKTIGEEHKDDVRRLYSIWALYNLKDSYALDLYKEDLRDDLEREVDRFGMPSAEDPLKRYKEILKKNGFTDQAIEQISKEFKNTLEEKNGYNFIRHKSVTLRFEPGRNWYKCRSCRAILPFGLFGKCGSCLEGEIDDLSDFSSINFLRKPIVSMVEDDDMDALRPINVEEHTAQLSHKDQSEEMWSTTEEYELRFQNIYADDVKPVDILSCTTTMEVGIDIGSLTAIGLRNVPPSRENYQQRSGRAGRRCASVSTVVTYCDKGRYDRHYFEHPDEIVSGNPRTPFIDNNNEKLARRHVLLSLLVEYLRNEGGGPSIDKMNIMEYVDCHYQNSKDYIARALSDMKSGKRPSILPGNLDYLLEREAFTDSVIQSLEKFVKGIIREKDNYPDQKLLDIAQDEGLIPTYSFPHNIVGFSVYRAEKNHIALEEHTDRSMDLALSEYAPGSNLTIKKKNYISGAISRIDPIKKIPIQFESLYGEGSGKLRPIKVCPNPDCRWFGFSEECSCPLCGSDTDEHQMLTPHGFSMLVSNKRQKDVESSAVKTYASSPFYSTMPSSKKMTQFSDNMRFEKRADQKLIVMNAGNQKGGFTICKRCGAAVNGDESLFNFMRVGSPFPGKRCGHDEGFMHVYLGSDFITDLVVYEIRLGGEESPITDEMKWIWIAAQSLTQAFCLVAGRILDVESSDLEGGCRLITRDGDNVVEIYLYDNLSSGAGYSADLAGKTEELVLETRKFLQGCDCHDSCFKCLRNYGNRRIHELMDRHAALDLLNWATDSKLPDPLSEEEQNMILKPLRSLPGIDCERAYVYPSIWNESKVVANGKIPISKFEIERQPSDACNRLNSCRVDNVN